MKKILIAALLTGLIATTALADSNVVSSANIVGYVQTETFAAGQFQILAPQFLQAPTNGIALGDAFGDVPDLTVVYTWNGTSYKAYTYYEAAPGWLDSIFTPSDGVIIEQGDAVWLKSTAVTNVIMSGDVPQAGSITNVLAAETFNLVACPYPVEMTLGDINTNSLSDLDVAYVWNGSAYKAYTYYEAAPGWLDSIFTPSDGVTIAVGQGFWLNSAAGGTLIFDKQY